ncbi:MAG: FKBP-type peptidyl-prolyl cis-trans isomerase [Dehalococcoidia bacterium]
MRAALWLVLTIPFLIIAGCGGDDDDGPVTAVPTATVEATATSAEPSLSPTPGFQFDFSRATTTASGLSFIDLEVGNGAQPRPDQVVAVRYTGRLAETGAIFDSTGGGTPVSFQLTRVIKGFAEGIRSMHVGGRRVLYIPADIAYGDGPPPGSGIPPGADLIFEVELVSVK